MSIPVQTPYTALCAPDSIELFTDVIPHNIIRWECAVAPYEQWDSLPASSYNGTKCKVWADQKRQYRCVVKSQNINCPVQYTQNITLNVESKPSGGFLTLPSTACYADNHGVLVLTADYGKILFWETQVKDQNDIQKINHTTYSLSYFNLTQSQSYRVASLGCQNDTIYSNFVLVTVLRCDTCPKATDLKGKNIEAVGQTISAQIEWKNQIMGNQFTVYYRSLNNLWVAAGTTMNNTFTITNLKPCQNYEIKVINKCIGRQTESGILPLQTTPYISNFEISQLTTNSTLLIWENPAPEIISLQIRYRRKGGTWISSNLESKTNRRLLSLYPDTPYEVEYRSRCGTTFTVWKTALNFKTLPENQNCTSNLHPPNGITSSVFNNRFVVIRWKKVPESKGVWLSYGLANQNPENWQNMFICASGDSAFLLNLTRGAKYRYRLRALCESCSNAGTSKTQKATRWSPYYELNMPLREESVENLYLDSVNSAIQAYPNPAKEFIKIRPIENTGKGVIQITNSLGQIIQNTPIEWNINQPEIYLSTTHLPSGVYIIQFNPEETKHPFWRIKWLIAD